MGTVGLNFGSPTSGVGFDVEATVTSIVSNLQKVETPWKNQLSTFQSQDTAISNLGTLLSNLSSDVTRLTDFSGVLAQKTGSSSDTNVLQLTSATSSATAGTHTVAVNSLSRTSSGYLTAIANASDTLTGSITIKAGNGQARTVSLPAGGGTLAGLASAINSSGAGVFASVLTDPKGSRLALVSGTSGGNGEITISDNSLADASDAGASLSYKSTVTGVDASLTVDGVDLTSASNTASNLIQGVTFQILAPTKTDSAGDPVPIQVIIGNDNSGVESAINTMVNDYNALIKAINGQEGNDSSGNPEPLFGSPTLALLQQQILGSLSLQSPNGYLDAIKNASDALSGTISVKVGSGTAHLIDISTLSDRTISGVADAINAGNFGVTAKVTTRNGSSTLTLLAQAAGSAGFLDVTSSILDTATSKTLGYTPVSDIPGLTSLGISMNNDGTISLDGEPLDSLLNSDFSSVVGFFQGANGWGTTVAQMLNQAGTSSSTGILKLALKANSTMESNLNTYIAKEDERIAAEKKQLTAELNQANQILQAVPSQLESVDMLYSAITGYKRNS
ncbi:MAG TPA: flagellar filament capping protein FliD [Terracidiphilus sp.]|nr:flagellar filament capping protein FliD [Terracidiphilus sp.]